MWWLMPLSPVCRRWRTAWFIYRVPGQDNTVRPHLKKKKNNLDRRKRVRTPLLYLVFWGRDLFTLGCVTWKLTLRTHNNLPTSVSWVLWLKESAIMLHNFNIAPPKPWTETLKIVNCTQFTLIRSSYHEFSLLKDQHLQASSYRQMSLFYLTERKDNPPEWDNSLFLVQGGSWCSPYNKLGKTTVSFPSQLPG